ncbi:hypothetical protein PSCICO_50310 [Pseudomonas cichorii]|uniref:ATP-binding protein n=1 Tax=Pseudomonas cichorii TaxID=36746 RepID=UPI0019102CE7|nr:ATP-binding protein [Pseudomonas cichorii]GFM89632.1 hypothetical protein PSCICO_50310 [Pseudomonas cichorii]
MIRAPSSLTLRSWIWRAFLSTSLIPLIVVEVALLAAYFLSNQSIRDSQREYLHHSAARELQASVMQSAEIIEGQLVQLSSMATLLARTIETELAEDLPYHPAELTISPDGARYSATDDGGAASFYSSITPLDQQDLDKVYRLRHVDFMMKTLKTGNPSIVSLYFNSSDGYNHIYPWFNTLSQYPHNMDSTRYNFYYLADAAHNPARQTVWTDVYLDPAGHGWMMSVITPVYKDDTLEGVVGIDITVDTILQRIARLHVPSAGYLVLVSNKLNIMALPTAAERDFSLSQMKSIIDYKRMKHDHFQPDGFNLTTHSNLEPLVDALRKQAKGLLPIQLNDHPHLVSWSDILPAGWHLLAVVDESVIMQETQQLARHYQDIGYLMVAGLIVFYSLFFAFLWFRSRELSNQLSTAIIGISNMLEEIGKGKWSPPPGRTRIKELAAISEQALAMGSQLAHAEARRGAAQQRLELVIESATEGLWEYQPSTNLFSFKGALCERFNLPVHPVDSEHLLARMPEEDRKRFCQFLSATQNNEDHVVEVEFRLSTRQDEMVWLLCRGRTLSGLHISIPPVAGTCVDIEALKQVEQSLREKTIEAQAASQAKSRFISGMSHELKTPLNAILGFAQLRRMKLASTDTKNADDLADMNEIISASEHLSQLLDDLLDWSSLQAEAPHLSLRPVDAAVLAQDCLNMIRTQTITQGIKVELRLPAQSCLVLADNRRLKQVLINLLSNAIKYNRKGGSIVIGVDIDKACQMASLFVSDSGPGIEHELQKQLFKPFQRLGKENSAIKGTGIGLALCRELAELMNGEMGVTSEPGVGSHFWISLPLFQDGVIAKPDTHEFK